MRQQMLFCLIQDRPLEKDELLRTDWAALFEEARQQAVLPLVISRAKKYREYIPETVYTEADRLKSMILMKNLQASVFQSEMIGVLSQGNYPYCILKGSAAAAYWPDPALRPWGDCDFLIDKTQKEELSQLFLQCGYINVWQENSRHIGFEKGDAHLEMHFEIAGIPYGEKGDAIRTYMKDVLSHCTAVTLSGCTFRAPAPEYHGLVLLLHMQHHMVSEGLGLRHLLDFCYFVGVTKEAPFWEKTLLPFLKQIGLYVYAQIVTKTGALYCGTPCPAWANGADDMLCDAFMQDILSGGNFGRKNKARSASGSMISQHGKNGIKQGKLTNLFLTLHNSTPSQYPIVKKVKILHPVFDVWRVFLYIGRTISGKRTAIAKMVPYAEQRATLYKQFMLFEA